MILLGNNDHLFYPKDVPGPVEAVIGGQPRVVQDHVRLGNALFQGHPVHGGQLVVILAAVVPGHEQLVRPAGLVELHPPGEAVRQHGGGGSVGIDAAAQHQDAVHRLRRGILQGAKLLPGGENHVAAEPKDQGRPQGTQDSQHGQAPQNPFLSPAHWSLFRCWK